MNNLKAMIFFKMSYYEKPPLHNIWAGPSKHSHIVPFYEHVQEVRASQAMLGEHRQAEALGILSTTLCDCSSISARLQEHLMRTQTKPTTEDKHANLPTDESDSPVCSPAP